MDSYMCLALEALRSGVSLYDSTVIMWNAGGHIYGNWIDAYKAVFSLLQYI